MYVIVDVEWTDAGTYRKNLTQLAAARLDRKWAVTDTFFSFVRPMQDEACDWSHAAFTGGSPESFLRAGKCGAVLSSFSGWLWENDILCFWDTRPQDAFLLFWGITLRQNCPFETVVLNRYITGFLAGEGQTTGSPYKIAAARGIPVPAERHNARHDVQVIQCLLCGISFPQEALQAAPLRRAPCCEQLPCNAPAYLYDTRERLIHRWGCPLIPPFAHLFCYETPSAFTRKKFGPCLCARSVLQESRQESVFKETKKAG